VSSEISFTLDGAPMTAVEGQSIAGALIGGGVMSWRHTRFGDQPRGVFCGIGACFDCLITVNDEPNVRACLAPVREGDRVMRQEGTGYGA
jgi:aerobic-type carbon monoxide dehydrogenase small subunit (CoxS/CutS family)